MAITAKQVNELRQKTGAGMMDCKKALVEAEGDFDKAIELLRKKGQKVAEKRVGREAGEGAVFAKADDANKVAKILELNCETDFVARNEDFQGMGEAFLATAYKHNCKDLESLLAADHDGKPVQEHLTDAMGRIGEKIEISKFANHEADYVYTYIHPGARVGVAIALDGGDASEIGRDLAMQIAAMSPIAVDQDEVSEEIVERELRLGREQALEEGKPEQIIEKIAQGKLKKFFKDNTLVNQEFVKDPSKTVGQMVKEHNPDLKIKAFTRMQLGQ